MNWKKNGLNCETEIHEDCFKDDPVIDNENPPAGCDHVLIFSKSNRTCGCYLKDQSGMNN